MSCNSDSFDLPLVLFSPWLIAEPAVVLCNQLNGTSVFIDLTLGLLARISGFDNHGNARKAAFSEKFCIAELKQIKDKGLILRGFPGRVLFTSLIGNKCQKLR